jgi:hypothetical protein
MDGSSKWIVASMCTSWLPAGPATVVGLARAVGGVDFCQAVKGGRAC